MPPTLAEAPSRSVAGSTEQVVAMLREFHTVFGHPIGAPQSLWVEPRTPVRPETWQLRLALIGEEYAELVTAMTAGDDRGVADALADSIYVVVGTALVYGTPHAAAVACSGPLPHHLAPYRNFAKRYHRGWFTHLGKLARSYADLVEAAGDGRPASVGRTLAVMHRQYFQIAALYRIPLMAMIAEVHRSNMSKLGADGKPLYRADGKVMKGPNYSPPDLDAALAAFHVGAA